MKATVGWTDRRFLVAGVPGWSAQLHREEVATWRDFALWYTVVTEVEDGMGGGGGGTLTDSPNSLREVVGEERSDPLSLGVPDTAPEGRLLKVGTAAG
jgi:hypothetical protein